MVLIDHVISERKAVEDERATPKCGAKSRIGSNSGGCDRRRTGEYGSIIDVQQAASNSRGAVGCELSNNRYVRCIVKVNARKIECVCRTKGVRQRLQLQ